MVCHGDQRVTNPAIRLCSRVANYSHATSASPRFSPAQRRGTRAIGTEHSLLFFDAILLSSKSESGRLGIIRGARSLELHMPHGNERLSACKFSAHCKHCSESGCNQQVSARFRCRGYRLQRIRLHQNVIDTE